MKKIFLAVVFMCALFFSVNAQNWTESTSSNENNVVLNVEGEGKIKWNTTNMNMGELEYMHPQTADFEFTNTGSKPLLITHVKAFCGCTKVDYPKTPILPGKSAKVSAVYNAASMGNFNKTVKVTFSDEQLAQHLTLTGKVVKKD